MQPSSRTLLINEILPAPAAGEMEWIELYNSGSEPVDVTGWSIRRTGLTGAVQTRKLGAVSVLPGEFLVVETGRSFLPNNGAILELLDAQGQVVHDPIEYPKLRSGQVYARTTDGGVEWRSAYPPSPGMPNTPPPSTVPSPNGTPVPSPRMPSASSPDAQTVPDTAAIMSDNQRRVDSSINEYAAILRDRQAVASGIGQVDDREIATGQEVRPRRLPASLQPGVHVPAQPYLGAEPGTVYTYRPPPTATLVPTPDSTDIGEATTIINTAHPESAVSAQVRTSRLIAGIGLFLLAGVLVWSEYRSR